MDEYDFWVFDLDGTLVGVEENYVDDVVDSVARRLGHEFTRSQIDTIWHSLRGSPDRKLREWGLDPDRFWSVFHEVDDPQARAEAAYLYDDAGVVGELEGPTAIVTHCQRHLAEPVLVELDIVDWFDAVVCCTDRIGWKPDPGPVERAMSRLCVADGGHRGVLAGDAPHDVGAAWNAGLAAVHVERHGHGRRGACVRADHRVGSLEELDGFG